MEDGKVRYDLVELENVRLFFLSVIELIDRAKVGDDGTRAGNSGHELFIR